MKKNIKLANLAIPTLAGLSISLVSFSYFMPKQVLGILPNLSNNLNLNNLPNNLSNKLFNNLSVKPTVNHSILTQVPVGGNANLSQMEQHTHQQINQYRKSIGLNSLTWDETISEQSKIHSVNMASGKLPLGHDQFKQRAEVIMTKITYNQVAENVAFNSGYTDPVTQAVQGWLKSPGHKKNIEGKYDLTGIGIVKNSQGEYYFTQIFVSSRHD